MAFPVTVTVPATALADGCRYSYVSSKADVELNEDGDRIVLWRKGRVAHFWTREEAEFISQKLIELIPQIETKQKETK